MEYRVERDFLGTVRVPASAYYGIFTVRAFQNFQISGSKPPREFIMMLALCKKSAAEANMQLGLLDKKIGSAIARAAYEVAAGRHDLHFILDAYTAGAGTPFNMNMNEVIANRALEIIGKKKGDYSSIHPNNHVNMSQSSNDIIPTAARLTLILQSSSLEKEARLLAVKILQKQREFSGVLKVGRTHLMDAVPLFVADELSAYSAALRQDIAALQKASGRLRELPIGGTALGTGINTHPHYKKEVVRRIAANTGIKVREGKNLFRLISQADDFLAYSSAIRSLASTLHRFSNDLKLLSSGPNTLVGEYVLPAVEPGSSIMPGKVNPSVPECMEMICNRVMGNDLSVLLAALGGQLQLNVQTPIIFHCLFESGQLLGNGMAMLRKHCVDGLSINRKKIAANLDASLILLTALAPYFGYDKMSEVVKRAQREGIGMKEAVLKEGLIGEQEYARLMSPARLARPSFRVALEGKPEKHGRQKPSTRQKLK